MVEVMAGMKGVTVGFLALSQRMVRLPCSQRTKRESERLVLPGDDDETSCLLG